MVSKVWSKSQIDHLKDSYDDGMHVSPAILAVNVHKTLAQVKNKLSELGLRNRIKGEKY